MENFYLFVITCVFLIILPGPDTAIMTKNTLTVGKQGGFKTMIGICCALSIHTLTAIVGLSAIIAKSALLFSIFKYIGAVYLIYLGIKSLWTLRNQETTETVVKIKYKNTSSFKQGFLTNLLNPKIAVFFLTFLPQFVNPGSHTFMPFLILGMTYIVLTIVWYLFYIYLLNQISAFMKKPKTQKAIEGITGTILIGFGIKLALEKAHT
ncbi:integral membrane TerC family protein [Priestia megaterium]|uniref:Integral membrane TerC family protein n=1 Tax=Priestia megaterium (strain ATCC 14581 / DSM 32 / CCUG 1817 / JCM 2506 / NBRC 15308 / NCIMB 9376 / NCTC 10342 / NRRL B-14308 / VKM B-512 / Ford 19) TaxID=1348623 RepID=A0A0B6AXD1_PRIM2|nr:integral membrane TerC family protein [Priestia megaterium NBRC 15308 = ATCC 14581]KFN07506.1 integral membrane TerC family protein [Priestia megaterium]MDR4229738.1 LysE family translocator [Priestia megaterium]NER44837.1 LysE family translocator [Priestia megaterium NBRC 15308 = ATCC 14581]QCY28405.1 LysE family translocator [Priestia megaterium NBRC 15308 = ATCC 14581]